MKYYKLFFAIFFLAIIVNSSKGFAQDSSYYPNGNPDVLNIQFNPFLWLPSIGGEISSEQISKDFDVPAVDLLSNLRFAFMFNSEISKDRWFIAPSYIYAKLGSENVKKTDKDGNDALVSYPGLVMNIFEGLGGMRFKTSEKLIVDPYVGIRYTNYTVEGWVEKYGPVDSTKTDFEESANYWDPVLGCKVHYFPHPRVPLTFKADIGGFGVGSTLSWTTGIHGGYTLSPTVDLFAGFIAYGSDFEQENALGNNTGLNIMLYGLDLGVRIMIPARSKDPAVFKKKAK